MILGVGDLAHTNGREGWIFINIGAIFIAASLTVLPHELCHGLVARLVGLKVHGIVLGSGPVMARGVFRGVPYRIHLFPWTGVTYLEIRDSVWFRAQRVAILLAGPMSHVAMVFVAVVFFRDAWQSEGPTRTFSPVFSFIVANFLLLYGNLYPQVSKTTGIASDGKQILALLSRNGMDAYRQWEGRSALSEAYLHLEARQWAAAEDAIRPCLLRHPTDWFLSMTHCLILSHKGLHQESLTKAKALLDLKPPVPGHQAWVMSSIAWSQIAIGDPAMANEAIENARSAYEAFPWEPSCISNFGHSQALYGDPSTAIELLTGRRMRANGPENQAIVECAISHARARLGMLADARQGIWRARNLDPQCEFLARTESFILSREEAEGRVSTGEGAPMSAIRDS